MTSSSLSVRVPVGLAAPRLSGSVKRLIIGGLLVWVIAITVVRDLSLSAGSYLPDMARYLAVESFVVAALVCVQRWRVTSDNLALRAAIAFGSVGIMYPAALVMTPWTTDGVHVQFDAILIRATLSGVAFVLLGPSARSTAHLRRVLLRGGAAVAATGGAAVVLALTIGSTAAGVALEALLVAGWTALVCVRRRARTRMSSRPNDWTSAAMLAMGLDEAIRLACVAAPGSLLGTASGFDLTAGVLFAWAAFADLRTCRRARPAEVTELVHELAGVKAKLEHAQQTQRDRLHDARSALVGVAGASALLARPVGDTFVDRADLARMIAAELTRLQAILDTETVEHDVDFDLAEALEPVLAAHDLSCPTMSSRVLPATVHGRPLATATALDDLLSNARNHAPGAAVTVSTQVCGDTVEIIVEDDGPGIPSDERCRVLERGARGAAAHAPGSGLGLYNAFEAISAQSGDLRLDESANGGVRVTMSLPLSPSPAGRLDKVAC